ncbi:MAG: StbB family protein [Saezia sp.]
MFLKIAIMNNSGNVGKSMICDNLLRTRIPDAEVIKIETINSDGSNDETISAKQIKQVFTLIDTHDTAIIDIGASNIEIFVNNLRISNGAHEEIDFFLIPTTPKPKQQVDTLMTIEDLLNLGVEKEKIKLIFNFHDNDLTVKQNYSIIFSNDLAKTLELDKISNQMSISDNPVFDMLGELGYSFQDIANDKRDFKTLIRSTDNKEERIQLSHLRSAQRLAISFTQELDQTFAALMKSCSIKLEV